MSFLFFRFLQSEMMHANFAIRYRNGDDTIGVWFTGMQLKQKLYGSSRGDITSDVYWQSTANAQLIHSKCIRQGIRPECRVSMYGVFTRSILRIRLDRSRSTYVFFTLQKCSLADSQKDTRKEMKTRRVAFFSLGFSSKSRFSVDIHILSQKNLRKRSRNGMKRI